jgi:hypothetical protein
MCVVNGRWSNGEHASNVAKQEMTAKFDVKMATQHDNQRGSNALRGWSLERSHVKSDPRGV